MDAAAELESRDAALEQRAPAWLRWMGYLSAGVAVGFGLLMIGIAATFGSCSAFGGRCPADPPPLWDDDVFGMSAFGTALIIVVPALMIRPSRRRAAIALVVGLGAAVLVGLIVRSAAHG